MAQPNTKAARVVRFRGPGKKAHHGTLARCWIEKARQHLERSRFACTIRPEEANHLPCLDCEADISHCLHAAVRAPPETADRGSQSGIMFGDAVGFGEFATDNLRLSLFTYIA